MIRLLAIVITPPDKVRWKKSSLTFGYASRLLSLFRKPSMAAAAAACWSRAPRRHQEPD